MNTLIIDDEIFAIKNLKAILKLFDPDVNVVDTASTVEEAIEKIDKLKPELIFLDIEMPDGKGFEVLEKSNYKNYQVIFVTAYSDYAIKALRMNALDYITKPVDPDDLTAALAKARENNKHEKTQNFEYLIESNKKQSFDKVALPTSNGLKYVDLKDIIRLQASSNYTNIFIKSGKSILVSKTLKFFDKTLDESGFIRVHQSHLVNYKHISEFHRGDGSYLVLNNGEKIPVSKSKRSSLSSSLLKR